MYDDYNRMCPKHPTLPQPCQICGELSRDVSADSPANTVVKGVNWQAQADVPYNTPRPNPIRKFNPSVELLEKLGPESGDRRYGAHEVPPPVPHLRKGDL